MNKGSLTMLSIVILIACAINYSEGWPFGNIEEKLVKIVEALQKFQKGVEENDVQLKQTVDRNFKTLENSVYEVRVQLREVTRNVNVLLEKQGLPQIET